MSDLQHTGNGFIVEGTLTVLPEDDLALIRIGDAFLDDLLRRRFSQSAEDDATGCVMVSRVRITVETLES